MVNSSLVRYYTTIYAQALSPCGKYIAASSCFGKIAVFNVVRLLNSESDVRIDQDVNIQAPFYSFEANEGPIFALASNDTYLISARASSVSGWSWKDILNKTTKLAWSLAVPKGSGYGSTDVNALALLEKDGSATLFVGCSDNNIHVFDLENQKLTQTFKGHTGYIHCLTLSSEAQGGICYSGGEDGLVMAWDTRTPKDPIHRIEPFKNEICHRPNYGKWIGCIAMEGNDDWMICGGGPTLSLWHLRSMSCNVTFPTPNSCSNAVLFHEDLVISAGTEAFVSRWGFNGEEDAKIPVTPFSVYSLLPSVDSQKKFLCVAGSSTTVDVCTNFKYKDFSLLFE